MGGAKPKPPRSTVSATKRSSCSRFSGPPFTRYRNASVTVALGTVDRRVSSASGTASPAKARKGVPASTQAWRTRSKPGSHARRPRSNRTSTQRAPSRSRSATNVHGWAARTGGKPGGSDSRAVRRASTSVSTLVMYQITRRRSVGPGLTSVTGLPSSGGRQGAGAGGDDGGHRAGPAPAPAGTRRGDLAGRGHHGGGGPPGSGTGGRLRRGRRS